MADDDDTGSSPEEVAQMIANQKPFVAAADVLSTSQVFIDLGNGGV
jgi:hypothetical protein